jgi:hypothetical protein
MPVTLREGVIPWLPLSQPGLPLVWRPGDLRAKSLELLQDGVRRGGPAEGSLGLVVGRHELLDPGDQFFAAGEASLADGSLGDDPKPAFHLIEPGGVGGCVAQGCLKVEISARNGD